MLQKITEVDVSSENFRYMQYAQGEVADIPAGSCASDLWGKRAGKFTFPGLMASICGRY